MAHFDIDPKTGEPFSLVEYTVPLAVNPSTTLVDAFGRREATQQAAGAATRLAPPGSKHTSVNDGQSEPTHRRRRAGRGSAPTTASSSFMPSGEVLRVLHSVLPPREWLDGDGTLYSQHAVDSARPTREDVLELEELLDHELRARQARPATCIAVAGTAAARAGSGDGAALLRHGCLCPVRETLFSQTYDELIRQVCLLEPARGLLLARVRDQHRMVLAAYASLAQSGVKYAADKAREAEGGDAVAATLAQDTQRLQAEVAGLRREAARLQLRLSKAKERHAGQGAARRAAQAAEIAHLTAQNDIFRTFLQQAESADIEFGVVSAPPAHK